MQKSNLVIGIDYGSKFAGTTVIAYIEHEKIVCLQSKKKEDADIFIRKFVSEKNVALIGLDAPLSLPKVYKNELQGTDYFYRASDKLLGAMSPMFLGGLTARAMQLSAFCKSKNIEIVEVYPSALAHKWALSSLGYKKSLDFVSPICQLIQDIMGYSFSEEVKNWHQIDAVLALASALRYVSQEADSFGDVSEGIIWV